MQQDRSRSRLRRGGAVLFFSLYAGLQLILPVASYFDERFHKFGWLMYANVREAPRNTVHWRSGETSTLEDIQRSRRIGLIVGKWPVVAPFAPAYLCRNLPDAMAVTVQYPSSGKTGTKRCR